MSRFAAFFLAGIICCQAFYNLGVLSYWVVNHGYIAANLCENRAKPELHCNGRCYLEKKIAGATEPLSAQGFPFPGLKKGLDLAECPFKVVLNFCCPDLLEMHTNPAVVDGHCATGFPNAVFHPPARRA